MARDNDPLAARMMSAACQTPISSANMPTINRIPGPYRFYFYSFDCNEPMHVHVRRERATCKVWLDPITVVATDGFSARELNRIRRVILEHRPLIEEAWREHCGTAG
jgi:hypothetical protein